MQPKRFMVALFKGSFTLEMVELNRHFVLQLLEEKQFRLVDLLGRKSGKVIDKIALLKKRKATTEWKNFIVLRDALAWMELTVISTIDAGDHVMMLCDLAAAKNVQEGNPLTLDTLREKKMIRI
jgi:flavin reductase (DIM6/NTAB) family NADH-FMN oxidoreductase RutF